MQKPFILDAAFRVNRLLTSSQSRWLKGFVALSFLASLLEVVGLASIVPYVLMVAKQGFIQETPFLQNLYDWLPVSSKQGFLLVLLLAILGLFIIKNAFSIFVEYIQSRFAFNTATHFAERQALYFLSRDFLFHQQTSNHEVLNKGKTIPFLFGFNVLLKLINFIGDALIAILILGIILYVDAWIFLAMGLVLSPIILFGYQKTKGKIREWGDRRNAYQPAANAGIFQISQAFPVIKLYNKERFFLERFVHYQDEIHQMSRNIAVFSGLSRKFLEIGAILGIVAIALYTIAIGMGSQQLFFFLSLYATASYKLLPTLGRLFDTTLTIKAHLFTVESLEANSPPVTGFKELEESKGSQPLSFSEKVQLKGVHFKYPDSSESVLEELDWVIPKQHIVGIAGKSGDGKSTLVNVLMQLLKQDKGALWVDQHKIDDTNRKTWQQKLGIVYHQNFLLTASLAENIAFAEKPASIDKDRLEEAIHLAGLKAFKDELPAGLKTPIKEEGQQISEGQKQRIAIARALYRDAEVLIFDEATSALDAKTENIILESAQTLRERGKTIVLVSHRLSTLRICDKINVIANGSLSSPMDWEELKAYYQSLENQSAGEKKEKERFQ